MCFPSGNDWVGSVAKNRAVPPLYNPTPGGAITLTSANAGRGLFSLHDLDGGALQLDAGASDIYFLNDTGVPGVTGSSFSASTTGAFIAGTTNFDIAGVLHINASSISFSPIVPRMTAGLFIFSLTQLTFAPQLLHLYNVNGVVGASDFQLVIDGGNVTVDACKTALTDTTTSCPGAQPVTVRSAASLNIYSGFTTLGSGVSATVYSPTAIVNNTCVPRTSSSVATKLNGERRRAGGTLNVTFPWHPASNALPGKRRTRLQRRAACVRPLHLRRPR